MPLDRMLVARACQVLVRILGLICLIWDLGLYLRVRDSDGSNGGAGRHSSVVMAVSTCSNRRHGCRFSPRPDHDRADGNIRAGAGCGPPRRRRSLVVGLSTTNRRRRRHRSHVCCYPMVNQPAVLACRGTLETSSLCCKLLRWWLLVGGCWWLLVGCWLVVGWFWLLWY